MRKALPWVLLALALGVWGNTALRLWDTRGLLDAQGATHQVLNDLTLANCTTPDMVRAAAEARAWPVADASPDWCLSSDRPVASWLRLEPSPPMPFAKDNSWHFAFDAAGCRVAWTYAPCP